jgi:predicted Fe-Mo cluster-binding NifX family protein
MSSKAMGALKNNIIQVLTINKRTLMNFLTAIQGLILQVV